VVTAGKIILLIPDFEKLNKAKMTSIPKTGTQLLHYRFLNKAYKATIMNGQVPGEQPV
jgi:hypothetical protein